MTYPTPAFDAFMRRAQRQIKNAERAEVEFLRTLAERGIRIPPRRS